MTTPNYNALLQSFWTPPRTPITENSNSNNHPTEPTNITEFLGEDLLWQQTIPAKEPNLKNIPNDLPTKLIKALQSLGITQLYSHQLQALQVIRQGKDSGGRVLTRGTLEGEYHKYEPKPASRFRPRKLEPVIKRRTGGDNY